MDGIDDFLLIKGRRKERDHEILFRPFSFNVIFFREQKKRSGQAVLLLLYFWNRKGPTERWTEGTLTRWVPRVSESWSKNIKVDQLQSRILKECKRCGIRWVGGHGSGWVRFSMAICIRLLWKVSLTVWSDTEWNELVHRARYVTHKWQEDWDIRIFSQEVMLFNGKLTWQVFLFGFF